jgi:competence protein ComEA
VSEPEQETDSSFLENLFNRLWPFRLSLLLFLAGFVLLFASFFLMYKDLAGGQSIVIEQSATSSAKQNSQTIKVAIEGEVVRPGVYEMKREDRVENLILKAGGFTENTDRNWIKRNLNQAQKLLDGAKIYIPRQDEKSQAAFSSFSFSNANPDSSSLASVVNLNTAEISELDSLPGIGLVTAQKIIDGRPYEQVADLLNRKIVGQSVFEKIKDRVIVF